MLLEIIISFTILMLILFFWLLEKRRVIVKIVEGNNIFDEIRALQEKGKRVFVESLYDEKGNVKTVIIAFPRVQELEGTWYLEVIGDAKEEES